MVSHEVVASEVHKDEAVLILPEEIKLVKKIGG